MKRLLITFVACSWPIFSAAPAQAQHQEDHAIAHGQHAEDTAMGDHDHEGHDHGAERGADHAGHNAMADENGMQGAAFITSTPEIRAALDAGGEPAVVDVLGVVCDFCAKAMNKTFGKRDEVAAVYVDLDTKALSLVFKPGATMDDETIAALVTRAGYKTSGIRRGAAALGMDDHASDDS